MREDISRQSEAASHDRLPPTWDRGMYVPREKGKRGRRLAYDVLSMKEPGDRRFVTVIDVATGLPPILALRYAINRHRRRAASMLESELRTLADLYNWFRVVRGVDLDEALRRTEDLTLVVTQNALGQALQAFIVDPTLRHVEPDWLPVGAYDPQFARAHNTRVRVWRGFLLWVAKRANWRAGAGAAISATTRVAQRAREAAVVDTLHVWFTEAREAPPLDRPREGFSDRELTCIEDAIGPTEDDGSLNARISVTLDDDGQAVVVARTVFAPETRLRNWAMYLIARHGGLRRGELLKLRLENLPPEEPPEERAARLARTVNGEIPPLAERYSSITVERESDDALDGRSRKPSLKRGSRKEPVPLPEVVLDELRRYVMTPLPLGRGRARGLPPYVFLATLGSRPPLSLTAADKIMKRVGEYAGLLHEARHPGHEHTFARCSWHRLRHVCAVETLELLYDAMDGWLDRYLKIMGWESIESAEPYINDYLRRRGEGRLLRHRASLTARWTPRREET